MPWYFYCVVPALMWAIVNLVDQHISRQYFPNNAIGLQATVGVFSFISGAIVIAISLPEHAIPLQTALICTAAGTMLCASFIPYIKAIQYDEASIVAPLFILAPVSTIIMAWIFLGEALSIKQVMGIALILIASVGVTYDFTTYRVKSKTILLMLTSCAGIGAFTTISRHFVQEVHWLPVAGYTMMGAGILSAAVFTLDRKSLANSISLFKMNSTTILGLFIVAELFSRGAMLFYQKALSVAPTAAYVHTIIDGLKPFLIYGLIFAFGFIGSATIKKLEFNRILAFQVICVCLMTLGLYILLIEG